ncbi:hypothetical protein GCM10009678_01680 [Actinomadura kijaniata]
MTVTGTAQARWLLMDGDRRLEVEASPRGKARRARLYVDDRRVAEKETKLKSLTFEPADLAADEAFAHFGPTAKLRVEWDWLGDPGRIAVLVPKQTDDAEPGDGKDGDEPKVDLEKPAEKNDEDKRKDKEKEEALRELLKRFEEIPFSPPEGTRAHRREKFAREHPRLFAARHVMLATGKVIWPLLGIGVFINLNVRIPWPDIPFPEIDLPDIPWPDVHIPWPDIDPPDVSLPGWLQAILATTKYWVPILIALGMAVSEYKRRKRQQAKVAELAAKKDAERKAGQNAGNEAGNETSASSERVNH